MIAYEMMSRVLDLKILNQINQLSLTLVGRILQLELPESQI